MYKCTFNIKFIDGKEVVESNNREVILKENRPTAYACVFALILKGCEKEVLESKYIGLAVRDIMSETEKICSNILKFEVIKVEENENDI